MFHKHPQTLMSILLECASTCNKCASSLLLEQDIVLFRKCIRLNMYSAQVCQMTASYVTFDPGNEKKLLEECAEICGLCAEESIKFRYIDDCKRSAEACLKSFEACMSRTFANTAETIN